METLITDAEVTLDQTVAALRNLSPQTSKIFVDLGYTSHNFKENGKVFTAKTKKAVSKDAETKKCNPYFISRFFSAKDKIFLKKYIKINTAIVRIIYSLLILYITTPSNNNKTITKLPYSPTTPPLNLILEKFFVLKD